MAHTPGPWTVSTGSVYVDNGQEWPEVPIAHMDREIGNGTQPVERDANARLIASAPALLMALNAIKRLGWGSPMTNSKRIIGIGGELDQAIAQARAAIKAATEDA